MIDTEDLNIQLDFYKQIFNSVQQAVIVTDTESKIILWNKYAENLYGYTAKEAIGNKTYELLSPDELISYHKNTVNQLNKDDNTITEYYLKNKNGITFPVRVTLSPLYNSDNKVFAFVGISEDISQEKAKEKQVIESEKQYRALAENYPNGALFLFDSNYQYRIANGEAFKHTSLSPNNVEGKKVWEVFPDIWEQIKPYHTAGLQGKKGYYEVKFQGRIYSNQVIPVLFESDNDNMAIVVTQDITRVKKTEIELIISKEYFKAIFEQAAAGIGVALPNGKLINSNQKLADILGFTIDELTKLTAFEITFPEDMEKENKLVRNILNNKLDTFTIEKRYIHKSGKIVWATLFSNVVRNEKGDIKYVIGVVTDISERKRVETELIIAKEKAEESEKKYRILVQSLGDGIGIVDKNENFIFANRAAEQIFQTEENELIGTNLFNFITQNFKEKILNETLIRKQGQQSHYELEILTKKNQVRIISVNATPYFSTNNDFIGTFGIFRDITEQKVLENALITAKEKVEKNEQLFKSLIENAPDVVAIIDENGKFKYGSPNAARHFGYTSNEVIGHSGNEFTHPDDLPLISKTLETIFQNPELKPQIKYRFKRKNGEYRWIETTFTNLLSDKAINGIILNFTDVTERKQLYEDLIIAKEKAEENEEKYKQIFDNTFDIMSIYEVTEDNRYKVITFNPAEAKLIGDLKNYKDKYIDECIPTELYNQFKQNYERCINEENQIEYEEHISFLHIDKIFKTQLIPLKNASGRIYRIIVISSDITENKNLYTQLKEQNEKLKSLNYDLTLAKEKAEESEQYLNSIFDETPILFWEEDFYEVKTYLDSLKHQNISNFSHYFSHHPEEVFVCAQKTKIINVNQAVLDSLGFACKEDLIINFGNTLTDISIQSYKAALISLSEGNHYFESITEHKTSLGELKQFYIKSFVPSLHINNFSRVFVAMLDITELKNTEKELLIAKEKAEESDRLKTAFLQNMSHEVRTPLNAIQGFSQLITNPNQSPEKLKKFSEIITESSDKLIGIITDVIEISQIQSKITKPKLTEFDIISFLNSVISKFKIKAIEKNIDFQEIIEIPFQEFIIHSDMEKLQRIFFHLIDNAIKFTTKGLVDIICKLENKNIKFIISDTGIGISEKMQKIIFEPFRQVETGITRNFGGNGLGLSLAKAYIELLNGSISLTSEVNKGTTFYISIPTNKFSLQTTEKLTYNKKYSVNTILIVEDEYSNYQYLLELLEETGLEILYAENGKKAVDLCRANVAIDLILMDIKMPIMDGHIAAKLIKNFRSDIPIIAQTAYALESERETFIGIFDDYITKPINAELFYQKLMKYIEK